MAIIPNRDKSSYIVSGGKAIVSFVGADILLGANGKLSKAKIPNGDIIIKEWGTNNAEPINREKLLKQSPLAPALVATNRNLTTGLELYYYKKVVNEKGEIVNQEVLPPENIKAFMKYTNEKKFFRQAAAEFFKHGNVFIEAISSQAAKAQLEGNNNIAKLNLLKCRFVRATEMNELGEVTNFVWRGDAWQKRSEKIEFAAQILPAYDENDPEQYDFCYHTGDDTFTNDEYYNSPTWEGVTTIMNLMNKIPTFYDADLKKGFVIRAHVEIPDDYFGIVDTSASDDEIKRQQAEITAKKEKFLADIDTFYGGIETTGNKLMTESYYDRLSNQYKGIKITPFKYELNGKALLEVYEKGTSEMLSAFQVHPSLGNIQLPNKLGSASDIRTAYLFWLAVHGTTYRDILLEILYIVKDRNMWDDEIYFGFKDMVITTLDNSKTGTETTGNDGNPI